jgi:short-subunit dehydrogenase
MDTNDLRPLAVVTGGSNGIGYELAKQFAEHGYDLLIAAEDAAHLVEAAQGLRAAGARQVEICPTDLAGEDGVRQLHEAIRALGCPVAYCASTLAWGWAAPLPIPISTKRSG